MTWFKVDDGFWRSGKVRKIGKRRVSAQARVAASGLWTLAGNWSADNLTDGFVPWEVVEDWDPGRKIAGLLMDADLWLKDTKDNETGIRFHDWADFQPSKADVLATRAGNARSASLHRDPELVAAIRDRDRNRCRYCGALVNWKNRRGGQGGTYDCVDPQRGNDLVNTVVACRACSSAKGSQTTVEAGMRLLPPGSLPQGPGPGSGQVQSSSDLEQNQNGSRNVLHPDPTRPDPLKETTTTSPNAAASGMDDGFDDFWAAYPKRVQKRDALKAWRQMRREKTPAERIIVGARGYAEFVRAEGRPPDKIKYPGSWLRAGAYDDHQPAVPAGPDLRDPADVLRAHWQAADAAAVARILGLLYVDPAQPPSDTTTYDRWTTQARRDWISHHHADAITTLTDARQESA